MGFLFLSLKVSLPGVPPLQEWVLSAGVQLSHLPENPCWVQSRHMFPITSLQTERIHSEEACWGRGADRSLCVLLQFRGSLDPDWLQTEDDFFFFTVTWLIGPFSTQTLFSGSVLCGGYKCADVCQRSCMNSVSLLTGSQIFFDIVSFFETYKPIAPDSRIKGDTY